MRRLTARECERLQGFPDDYTLIPYRGKPASDSARYKALGNSMAVPQRKREPQRVTMRPSVGRPDPEAVLPLLHRLVEEKSKNDADRERRLLPQVQQG